MACCQTKKPCEDITRPNPSSAQPSTFRQRIERRLETTGFTLAELVNAAGLDLEEARAWNVEADISPTLNMATIPVLADLLECNLRWLLNGEEPEEPAQAKDQMTVEVIIDLDPVARKLKRMPGKEHRSREKSQDMAIRALRRCRQPADIKLLQNLAKRLAKHK